MKARLLALVLVAAGTGTLGGAAAGLAATDDKLATAAAEVRLASERDDCPLRERPERPEL